MIKEMNKYTIPYHIRMLKWMQNDMYLQSNALLTLSKCTPSSYLYLILLFLVKK